MKKLAISILVGITLIGVDANARDRKVELSVQKESGKIEEVRNPDRVWVANSFNEALDRADAGYLRGRAIILAKTTGGKTESFTESQWDEFKKAYNSGQLKYVWFYQSRDR